MLFSSGLCAISIYAQDTSPESFACKLRGKVKPNRESLTNHGSKEEEQEKEQEQEDCKASRTEGGEQKGGEAKTGQGQRHGE